MEPNKIEHTRCFLFVGGPLDGQVRDINGRPGSYRHQWMAGRENLTATYILEPVEVERRVLLYLYREESVRMVDVVLRLMASYCDSVGHAARLNDRRNA